MKLPDTYGKPQELLENGFYQSVITKVELKDGNEYPYLLITFELGKDVKFRYLQSLSPKAMTFLKANLDTLNVSVSDPQTFHEQALVGRHATVFLTQKKDKNGVMRNEITIIKAPDNKELNPVVDASTWSDLPDWAR